MGLQFPAYSIRLLSQGAGKASGWEPLRIPVLEDWVLMEDPFRKSARESRKCEVRSAVQEDWGRAEARSHKELMKELGLPGIEQRRQREWDLCCQSAEGRSWPEGANSVSVASRNRNSGRKPQGARLIPQYKRKYSQDLSLLKTREEGGSITHH